MNQFATPEELEKHHVRDVYDKIAPHFAGYSHKAWPRVEEFLLSLPAGSLIADVGCGTGKYLGLALDSFVIGSDSCEEFAEIAMQRGHNVVACDNQSLPFRESCFDAVISVGVIHHFASGKRRSKALEELYRILRPGGRMLVYVWAFEQEQRKFDGQDVLVPYKHFQRNKVLARRSLSAPVSPRQQAQFHNGSTPNMTSSSWRSGRARSSHDCFGGHVYKRQQTQTSKREDSSSNDTGLGRVQVNDTSKYAVLRKIRNQEPVSSLRLEKSEEDNPVTKISKFLNSVLKKVFNNADDGGGESEKLPSASANEKTHQRNRSSENASSEFSPKFSALMTYFSSEKRETILKTDVLSQLARKLFAWKDDLRLDNDFVKTLDYCDEIDKEQREKSVVVIGLKKENVGVDGTCGHQAPSATTSVSLNVMARLVDSLVLPSDVYNDSSSSSDALSSDDSSSAEGWNQVEPSHPTHSKKTFQHTTISCQEPAEPVCAADKDSQYSSSSSFFSTTASSSSQSSPLLSSSSSSPRTETSSKLATRKLQRYYHVFCEGELPKLVQDGIPSAVILKEYYDHGNWAVILEKAISRKGCAKTLKFV
ncbi:probable tRNA methyltransferase 9B isoform X1 [Acropora muricata]|uniref:probable tRNA methyltransferase 9B isoform X1 n=2 Tax=Acropora muricata TaxID=159855 RepID=UPI0034E3E7E6